MTTEREMLRAILDFASEHEDDDAQLVSERARRVPRGREVPEPEVLKHRPLKPPTRRTEEA